MSTTTTAASASKQNEEASETPESTGAAEAEEESVAAASTLNHSYRQLYPPSNASRHGTIPINVTTDNGGSGSRLISQHELHYEIHGHGPLRALFLHGGPGAGCTPNHARFFNPAQYTVVLLDQRGAGKSIPRGSTVDNTLHHLVQDCELVRQGAFSGAEETDSGSGSIRPWDVVLGGSWGATLGLAYAQSYPRSIRSLILRGICTLRSCEVNWLFSSNGLAAGGSVEDHQKQLADAWNNFSEAVLPASSSSSSAAAADPQTAEPSPGNDNDHGREALHAYYDCLMGGTDVPINATNNTDTANSLRLAAAMSWMMWEMAVTRSASATKKKVDPNNNNRNNNLVLVSSPDNNNGKWRFENPQGELVNMIDSDNDNENNSPDYAATQLRRNIRLSLTNNESNNSCTNNNDENQGRLVPRQVRPIDANMPLLVKLKKNRDNKNSNSSINASSRWFPPDNYIPAQAMLTCYYSVNDRYVMGNYNLLENASIVGANESHTSSSNSRSVPPVPMKIIGIQGGLDPICPPDTAMDLLQAVQSSSSNEGHKNSSSNSNKNFSMELRIPLHSGHSMYDPAIQHELIQATDRLAAEFLNISTT